MYIAWKNLVTKKLRTLLTIMGVVVGIGSVFFLLSFGLGLQDLVTKQVIGNQSVKTIDVTSTNSRILKLDNKSIEKMQGMSHVELIGVEYAYPGSVSFKGGSKDVVTYGIDTNYGQLLNLKVSAGRVLSQEDNTSVVLNVEAVKAFGFENDQVALGKKIDLLVPLQNSGAKEEEFEKQFKVVGVVETGSGSEIYIPSFHFDLAGVPNYSQVRILTDDVANTQALRKSIEAIGFQTTSPSDTLDQVNQIFTVFNLIMIGFGSIGMFIAVIGMFNTLTISLLERTREIGLMMALGGRNRDMGKMFTVESLLLSVIGAIIGIIIAIIIGQVINTVMVGFAESRGVHDGFQLFAVPLWLVLGVIGFMAIVGITVSLFPARRARKINPIDALRRE